MRRTLRYVPLAALAVLLVHCAPTIETEESSSLGGEAAGMLRAPEVPNDPRDGLVPLRARDKTPRGAKRDDVVEAIAYLTAAAASHAGIDAEGMEFDVEDVGVDPVDGLTHVRLQQKHQGLPVWGADSVVHLAAGSVVGAAGAVAPRLRGMSTKATLQSSSILERAKADRYGDRPVTVERESVERVIHVGADGEPRVALHTIFGNELEGDLQPALWHHIYDANTGDLLARWNGVHTLEQASGASGNPKLTHAWQNELDVEKRGANYVMTTAAQKTINMKQSIFGGAEVTGPLANIGDAPLNDAHGYGEITLKMMKEWMGRNSIDDRGMVILSRAHYGRNFENAFWDGRQMTYGDGASHFYPLSGALDVVAHEIHHGFTERHSRLAYSNQAGGLNEGFSDIAGKTAEFYYKANPGWDLGGDIFKQTGALRYMCTPRQDGKSIDHVSQMRPGLDPHYSSGLPNKVFCLSSKRLSPGGNPNGTATKEGVKRAGEAFFLANAKYWTSGTTFQAGCEGVLDAAQALNFTAAEQAALKQSWADVGVTCN
jgi:vibriolysin